ncbi:hypothetical protein [Brevibacillus agri]|uniref:hypothetical protein n=1 Tax=Brevibacillus agri TaxID=51101 RepID=UPI0004717829|nr:hypothetical protein [Brevibacillus agri]
MKRLKMKITMDNGDVRQLTSDDGKPFTEFVRNFFSARYFIGNGRDEAGNAVIDTLKVSTIEIVEVE